MTDEPSFEFLCTYIGYEPKKRLIDSFEVAKIRRVSISAVRSDRVKGVGPKFMKPPGTQRALYSEYEVLLWLYENRKQSTSEGRAA